MKDQKIYAAFTDAVTPRETENREIAYQAALESIVLLKNDGALPIAPGKIALFGAGVPMTVKGGTGSGEVNERHTVSILEGMENAGFEVVSKRWIEGYIRSYEESYRAWKQGFKLGFDMINYMMSSFQPPVGEAITEADVADTACRTAMYVASRQAGEGADKRLEQGEFDLTEAEIRDLRFLKQHYAKVVLVINSGAYMNLNGMEEEVDAVLFFCQQGCEGGRALADIISGKVSPSGKLTDTWAKCYEDVPCGELYSYRSSDERRQVYKEGIYVGYRYYDTFEVGVRYPFGFGLSYTEFESTFLGAQLQGQDVTVEVCVKNVGDYAGAEVIQLYTSCPDGKLKKEYQRLTAFAKTRVLAPGEAEKLSLHFTLRDLASYSESDSSWVLERGDYILRVGNSSAKTEAVAAISMEESFCLEALRPICPVQEEFAELTPRVRPVALPEGCPVLNVDIGTLVHRTVSYDAPVPKWDAETEKLLSRLSTDEMVETVVGTGMGGMLDSSLNFAPGTVGRTTGKLVKKGIRNVNLADGPAGLRLLRESALNKKGKLRFVPGNFMLSVMEVLPGFLLSPLMAKKDARKLYQFTTAFPVGTALAQTWNTALCQSVGEAVSREMSEYGITFWLAPAMNIHKNPLCGRNFEYLSEDPLLTGKIAAALVRGAQSIPGNYATIKHFACNNAENQRTHSNSILHERALREIYLRGFEICVKESRPKAVMTSYNLINGVYSPNSRDLCTDALRCEWGFDGVVMTDWFSTASGQASPADAIAAGNDLLMPGGSGDKKGIRKALKSGSLSTDALRTAAGNVLDAVLKGMK